MVLMFPLSALTHRVCLKGPLGDVLLHDHLRTGPKHLTLRTFYQRIIEQCFCQDTIQTFSCSMMQFTEACHRENKKTRYFRVSQGP